MTHPSSIPAVSLAKRKTYQTPEMTTLYKPEDLQLGAAVQHGFGCGPDGGCCLGNS